VERFHRNAACERARSWASLDLDGELSQFERVLLGAHMRRCAPCAAAATDMQRATALLRAAPLALPASSFAPPPRRFPRRTTRTIGVRLLAATGLTAAAAALGVLAGTLERSGSTPPRASTADVAFLVNEDRLLRRVQPEMPVRQRALPPGRAGGNV
jgi:anti-sigma factor RsiW